MPNIALPPAPHERTPPTRRVVLRASRPSLIDLRFKGDPWVVGQDGEVAVCLGDYHLTEFTASPFDVPSLNRWLQQLRLGQARRNYQRRVRKLTLD
jgi:hypothetical protein